MEMKERFVGSRFVSVEDGGVGYRVWVLYPTSAAPASVTYGPYTLTVAEDAPLLARSEMPLVAVSHGSGSSPFLFRDKALRLAREGFVVVLVEHPGNHRMDDALAGTDENLARRPRHLRLAVDAVLADSDLGPHVAASRIAVMGQSLGAYTALAVAGGTPWSRTHTRIETEVDPRVAALVLLTPATFWYVPEGALSNVRVPILIYAGAKDTMSPPWHAHLVEWTVPDRSRVTLRIVEHAAHLSLLSELPKPSPYRDPEGFDRQAVHARMQDEIVAFLRASL